MTKPAGDPVVSLAEIVLSDITGAQDALTAAADRLTSLTISLTALREAATSAGGHR